MDSATGGCVDDFRDQALRMILVFMLCGSYLVFCKRRIIGARLLNHTDEGIGARGLGERLLSQQSGTRLLSRTCVGY